VAGRQPPVLPVGCGVRCRHTGAITDDSATPSGPEWVTAFAAKLGVAPPTPSEIDELLALAGTAAHASERLAAPLACWLVGRAGLAPHDAHVIARDLS
jgi:hypothetical protein